MIILFIITWVLASLVTLKLDHLMSSNSTSKFSLNNIVIALVFSRCLALDEPSA